MSLNSPFHEDRFDRGWNLDAVLRDYRIAYRSRQCSILGRREVFAGRAKFGIFGEGKEIAQLAMAYAFRKGDFRSGYYRDQTVMFALDLLTAEQFFAQLYANPEVSAEPAFGGLFKWVFGAKWDWRTFEWDRDMPKVDAELGPAVNGVLRGDVIVN